MRKPYLFNFVLTVFLGLMTTPFNEQNASNLVSNQATKKTVIEDWDARLEYARLLKNLQRYNESYDQYQRLLKEKPDSSQIKIELAEILYYKGKKREALESLEEIPQNQLDEKSLLLMAEIYQSLKEYHKAENIFRAELDKNPSNSLIQLKLAELLSWQKRYPESLKFYRDLLNKYPDDIQLRRKYAIVLMWKGDDREAAEELEKTLR